MRRGKKRNPVPNVSRLDIVQSTGRWLLTDRKRVLPLGRARRQMSTKYWKRREYSQWKTAKRQSNELPKEGFIGIEKRAFELQLHYGRRWMSKYPKIPLNRKLGIGTSTEWSARHPRPGETRLTPCDRDDRAVRGDNCVKRYKAKYPAQYQPSGSASELEEPDWGFTDPTIEARWYHYQFLGECYIDGMMQGQAIEYQNLRQIHAQVFEIR